MNPDDVLQVMVSAIIFVVGGLILGAVYFPDSIEMISNISGNIISLIIYIGIGVFLVVFFKELIDEI